MSSFTVAAWVYATAFGTDYRTAVSIDGVHTSAFYLQYRADSKKWCITMAPQDTDTRDTAQSMICSTIVPVLNTWVHLALVYDAANHVASLYVNGAGPATVSFTFMWTAPGPLAIGRGKYASNPSDWWQGRIDDVRVYQRALSATQIANLVT